MVATGDILEFSLQSYFQTPANRGLNVFQYEVTTDVPFTLASRGADVLEAWYGFIVPLIQPVTTTQIVYEGVAIRNLTDGLEIFEGQPDSILNGAIATDSMPPFVSWGFKLTRTNTSTRNGSKRFWGVPEAMSLNGQPAGDAITALPLIAEALGLPVNLDVEGLPEISVQLQPVIVRKDETGAIIASQFVNGAQFRSITTQNTRKQGRGM